MRVLIVDGCMGFCKKVSTILKRDGHEVYYTHIPSVAPEFCKTHNIAICIMRIKDDERRAYELIKILRDEATDTRIIAMSDHDIDQISIETTISVATAGVNTMIGGGYKADSLQTAVKDEIPSCVTMT